MTRAKIRKAAAELLEPVGGDSPGDGGSPTMVGDGEAESALTRTRRLAA